MCAPNQHPQYAPFEPQTRLKQNMMLERYDGGDDDDYGGWPKKGSKLKLWNRKCVVECLCCVAWRADRKKK